MSGTLYLVATPIGNLQDITFRAVEILKTVDLIACEDTRHTRNLLNFHGITGKVLSYHEHNEAARSVEFARLLEDGKSIAIVSDAGTPGINDPGFEMVAAAHAVGARVVPIPGPAAFVSALVVSGLPTDSLFFGGFLPSRKGERRRRLENLREIPATLIFYESPHRLARSLIDCLEILGDRRSAVARELTKIHEEIVRGSLSEMAAKFTSAVPKGEIVLVINRGGAADVEAMEPRSLVERIRELESEGADRKTALKMAAKEFAISKSEAYRILQSEKDNRLNF